jgi:hypothetical protein
MREDGKEGEGKSQLQRFQQFLTEHLQSKRKHPQPKMRHWLETPTLFIFDTLVNWMFCHKVINLTRKAAIKE